MPPIEAIAFGATVITTDRTSTPEVAQGNANYVDDSFSVDAWIDKMKNPYHKNSEFHLYIIVLEERKNKTPKIILGHKYSTCRIGR